MTWTVFQIFFTGSLLKIYVCDVNKTLLSMKVKYIYVIQNRKYTGGTVQKKKNLEHRSGHILSVLSLYQCYFCIDDLIFDTLCITTPVLDKCVKSIMEGMFTNKNYRKKRKKCRRNVSYAIENRQHQDIFLRITMYLPISLKITMS
jgi:hypothetical protein